MAKDKQTDTHNTEMTFLVALILVGVLLWLLWTYANFVVVVPIFFAEYLQYKLLAYTHLMPADDNTMAWVESVLFNPDACNPSCPPSSVNLENLWAVMTDVGNRMYIGYILSIFTMAVFVMFKMKGQGLRRIFSLTGRAYEKVFRFMGMKVRSPLLQFFLKIITTITLTRKLLVSERREWVNNSPSFIHYQSSFWKVSMAAADFDSNRNDPIEMPAMTPPEWLRANKVSLNKKEGLDEDTAAMAFEKQLGPPWNGILQAPYYAQAIAVISALNVKRDSGLNDVVEGLMEIHIKHAAKAESMTRELLAKYLGDQKIVAAINKYGKRHAYLNTAMVGIYGWGGPMREWGGGKAGVLSPSMFRWLKKIDRTMWYCLNNVGRRAFHIEGAGVISHFQAERISGQPISEAYMDGAVDGLLQYINDQSIVDIDEFFHVEKEF